MISTIQDIPLPQIIVGSLGGLWRNKKEYTHGPQQCVSSPSLNLSIGSFLSGITLDTGVR